MLVPSCFYLSAFCLHLYFVCILPAKGLVNILTGSLLEQRREVCVQPVSYKGRQRVSSQTFFEKKLTKSVDIYLKLCYYIVKTITKVRCRNGD